MSRDKGGRNPAYPIRNEDRYMTLQEIADILGTSRERVRQIEQRALGKIRRKLRAMGYKPDDFFGTMVDTPKRSTHNNPE
jgi:hypothetical protein